MESRTVSYLLQAKTSGNDQIKIMGDELMRVKVLLGEMSTTRAGMQAVTEELSRSASGARTVRTELDQIRQAGQASSASLVAALNDLSNKLDFVVGKERIVIQETVKLDGAVAAAARGVNTLGNMYARGAVGSTEFASKSAALRLALGGVTESAGFLSKEAALAERALKALAAAEGSAGAASPAAQRFKLEAAAAREASQAINSERIAWQGCADQNAVLAGMARRETAIRSTIASLTAEKEALNALGVPEQAQLKRIQELTALTNSYSIQLRTAVSVQNSINDVITRGSLGAGVRDGTAASNQAAAGATRSLTAETERLTAAEKLGLLTKKELAAALLTETTAHRTALTAIESEMLALRQLGVLDLQQTQRLAALAVEQDRYTAALLRSTTAQREAAQAGNLLRAGAMGAGASGKLNGAAMGLSFVSPELGMGAMLLQMGPQIAGIAAGFLAIGGAIKTVTSGMNEFADWNRQMTQLQALTHLSGHDIQALSGFFRELSTEVPLSAKELGEMGRQAVLVGMHSKEAIETYVTSMASLSVVLRDVNGQSADVEKVGQEIVKVLRSTGLTTEEVNAQFATTVDTLVALKTQFGVAIPEVTNLAKYWSSYAASIGMSTTQIWAWSAALISVGARAQGAGGALAKILETASAAAAAGGKEWDKWAQLVGRSAEAAKELLKQDPNTFLTAMAQGTSNSSKTGKDLSITLDELHLNTAQVVRTVSEMAVALPSMTRAQEAAAAGARDHGLALRTAKEAADNYKDKLITLGHTWDNFKLSLGAAFTPMANDVVDYLDKVLKRLGLIADAWRGMPGGDQLEAWVKGSGLDGKITDADKVVAGKLLSAQALAQSRLKEDQAQIDKNPNAWNVSAWKRLVNDQQAQLEIIQKQLDNLQASYRVTGLPVPGPLFDKNGNPTTGQAMVGKNNYVAPDNGASSTSGGQVVIGVDMLRQALGLIGDRTGTPFGQTYGPNGSWGKHNGEDIFAPTGTAVNAPFTGWLTKRWSESLGNVVTMFDAVGNKFELGHLEKYGPGLIDAIDKAVDKRLMVQQGALIAYVGQTGTGAHKELGPGNSHAHAMGWNANATGWNDMVSPFSVMYQGFNNPGAWGQKAGQPGAAAAYSGESQKSLDRNLATTQALMDKAGDKADQYAGRLEHIRQAALNLAHSQSQGSDEWLKAMATWSSANSAIEKLSGGTDKYIAKTGDLRTYGDAALLKIKALEAAKATGDPDKSSAAERDLADWIGKSKIKQAVYDAEAAAYQTRKQNQTKADQDAAKAEQDRLTKAQQTAALIKSTQAALDSADTQLAQTRLERVKASLSAQLEAEKGNAAARLNLQRNLGSQVQAMDDALAKQQRDKAQSKADQDAKTQVAALDKNYGGHGKVPQSLLDQTEQTRLKLRADAETAYQNRIAANAEEQKGRVTSAQNAVYAKEKQVAAQRLQIQQQVTAQLAGLDAAAQQARVKIEEDELSKRKASQAALLNNDKLTAQERLDIVTRTSGGIEAQALKVAETQKQASYAAAAAAQKATLDAIPKGASDANVSSITKKAAAQLLTDQKAADRAYTLAAGEAQQAQTDQLRSANTTQLQEQRKFADELSKLQVSTATATAGRIKDLNDAEITAAGDNLQKKLELTKKYSQEEFNRQAQILQATKKAAKDAANLNEDKAPPEVVKARLGQVDADYRAGYVKAQQARAAAVTAAQKATSDAAKKEKEDIASLQKSYRDLTDGIQKKIEAGTFDDVARRDALQSFNDLTRQSDKLGLSQNDLVKATRATTYAFIENSQAAQQLIQDSKDRIQQIKDEAAAEEEAAGGTAITITYLTNMLHELIAQDIDPRDSGFTKLLDEIISKGGKAAKAAQFVKDNLDKLESDDGGQSPAAAQYRGKQAIDDANNLNKNGNPADAISASEIQDKADSLAAQIIDEIFNVATKDSESVAENQWRDIVMNARKVMDSQKWNEMGASGRAEFNDNLAEVLAKAISNETDPSKLQGLLDFANKEIKDGMFDGVSSGLKEGVQQAVSDAAPYLEQVGKLAGSDEFMLDDKGKTVRNPDYDGTVGGVRDSWQGPSSKTTPKPPGSDFAALSQTLAEQRDAMTIDPAQSQAFLDVLQQARTQGGLTQVQFTQLSSTVQNLGKDFSLFSDDALSKVIDGYSDLIYKTGDNAEAQGRLDTAMAEQQKRFEQVGATGLASRLRDATDAADKLRSSFAANPAAAATFEQGLTRLLPRLENLSDAGADGAGDQLAQVKADIQTAQDLQRAALQKENADNEQAHVTHLKNDEQYSKDRQDLAERTAQLEFRIQTATLEKGTPEYVKAQTTLQDALTAAQRAGGNERIDAQQQAQRRLEDIQAQSVREQLDAQHARGMDEASFVQQRAQQDIDDADRALLRAVQDNKDIETATATHTAAITKISTEQNDALNALDKKARRDREDLQTQADRATLDRRHAAGMDEAAFVLQDAQLKKNAADLVLARAIEDNKDVELAKKVHTQALIDLEAQKNADLTKLNQSSARTQQDIQIQADRERLDRQHAAGMDERAFLAERLKQDQDAVELTFSRSGEDGKDPVVAKAQRRAALDKLTADSDAALNALDKKDRRADEDRDLQTQRDSLNRLHDQKLISERTFLTQMAALDQQANQTTLDRANEDQTNQAQALKDFNAQKLKIAQDLKAKLATLGIGDTQAIEDANAQASLATLEAQHNSKLISDERYYADKYTLDKAAIDRELQRARDAHQNLEVAQAQHDAKMTALDAQYAADKSKLAEAKQRAQTDLQLQLWGNELERRHSAGLNGQKLISDREYINQKEHLAEVAATVQFSRDKADQMDGELAWQKYQDALTAAQRGAAKERQDLAKAEFEAYQAGLAALGSSISGVFSALGLDNFAKINTSLFGMLDTLEKAPKALQQLQASQKAFAGDKTLGNLGGVLASVGGVVGLIGTAINFVGQFGEAVLNLNPKFALWKKNLLDIADIEKKNLGEKQVGNFINPFFDKLQSDIDNRTKTANATVWQRIAWWAFGGAPKIMQDEAAKSLAKMSGLFNDYAGTLGDVFRSALGDAFTSGDWGKASQNLEKSFDAKVGNLMISKLAELQMKALNLDADIQAWAEAINKGDYSGAAAINARIKAKVSTAFSSPELQAQISSIPGFGAGAGPSGSVGTIDSQISDLQDQQKNATSKAEYARLQGQIDALTKRREGIAGTSGGTSSITDPAQQRQRDQLWSDYTNETDPTKKAAYKKQLDQASGGGSGTTTITLLPSKDQLDQAGYVKNLMDSAGMQVQAGNLQIDAAKRQQDAASINLQAAGMNLLAAQTRGTGTSPGRNNF